MARHTSTPQAGAFKRHFTDYSGIFYDEFSESTAWLREKGSIRLPALEGVSSLTLKGECLNHPKASGVEQPFPGLKLYLNGSCVHELKPTSAGPWTITVQLPKSQPERLNLSFELTGTSFTNALAFLGRVTGLGSLQRFRHQHKNRQLRLISLETNSGEFIYDFSQRHSPFCRAFARKHAHLGLNIVGFLTADLGIGESARSMVRAADAAAIPSALVSLKLHCKNRLGDMTYQTRLQETNPYDVNVVHIDPPASRDIDHHHGQAFRKSKYSIGYFAWELTEFPDSWLESFDYFDEIWCPSEFSRTAIALKSPIPVLMMPHSIEVAHPKESKDHLRKRFNLPQDTFLFLSLFDLNSYAERKNPKAAIEAFRLSGLADANAGLVIKVHNAHSNPVEFEHLKKDLKDIPNTFLITETLSRPDITALEAACDVFVSLHRAEGFGLGVAECMALGKPVICTDFSATTEFVNESNGCPVRFKLKTLTQNVGPYSRGGIWADPDVNHAADYMKRLSQDKSLVEKLGNHARETITQQFAPAVIGKRYKDRLEAIASF